MSDLVTEPHSIKISVDRGGTFTDVHASWPTQNGLKEIIFKLLSSDPGHYVDAPREGVRRVLELATDKPHARSETLPIDYLGAIRLSTTVATNALLERKGAPHALLITKGFKDLLHIGTQARPQIFALDIKRPDTLYSEVVEVDERVTLTGYTSDPFRDERGVLFDAQGNVVRPHANEYEHSVSTVRGLSGEPVRILKTVDEDAVTADLQKLYDAGYRSLAIVLMHAFTYPQHEEIIANIAQKIGFTNVSLSSKSMPMIRIVARGTSTTADAYLTPILRDYINGFFSGFDPVLKEAIENGTSPTSVEFMRSDGGLTSVNNFTGLKSILSGPAGGVVGYALTSYIPGGQPVIGFDMGGTSTDVSRFAGEYETVFETTTAGVTVQSPQLDINTVAAGGGSQLFWRNGLMHAGPESVGSHPGPACYRKGGPAAITDANLVLGRLLPDYFPKIFGPNENESLDPAASYAVLEELARQINAESSSSYTVDEIAWGFLKVANEAMARPIRTLTEARGFDTTKHILASFGGAGGQHACAIAKTLGIRTVLIHKFSSILSAYGMALSERVVEKQEPSSGIWSSETYPTLAKRLDFLAQQGIQDLESQGFKRKAIAVAPYLNLRFDGTDTALMIKEPEDRDFAKAFVDKYRQEFGFVLNSPIVVDDVRVRCSGRTFDDLGPTVFDELQTTSFAPIDIPSYATTSVFYDTRGRVPTPIVPLESLPPGSALTGPALIIDGTQTLVIDPDANVKVTSKHVVISL